LIAFASTLDGQIWGELRGANLLNLFLKGYIIGGHKKALGLPSLCGTKLGMKQGMILTNEKVIEKQV